MAKSKIEEKYQKLTDREHVLHRPYMYVGSTEPHNGEHHLFDGEKVTLETVVYNPAFLKIFDEMCLVKITEFKCESCPVN